MSRVSLSYRSLYKSFTSFNTLTDKLFMIDNIISPD